MREERNMNTEYDDDNDDTSKQFIIDELKWLGIYISIGFILSFFLVFPASLVAALGVYILIYLYIRKRMDTRKYGSIDRMKNLIDLLSSSSTIKYYCVNCGKEHREVACPNCGSKMKRIET
jgi:hypothetical protein